MFTLPILSATDLLEHFTQQLEGQYDKGFEEAVLKLDNAHGRGEIRALDLQPGFSTLVYDITFNREITFKITGEETKPVYFLYCLKGYYIHEFEDEAQQRKVREMHNVITTGSSSTQTIIRIPAGVPLQFSVIWILRTTLEKLPPENLPRNSRKLMEIIHEIIPGNSYSYFGSLRPKTADFAKLLFEIPKSGVVGRLLTEAALLNVLASQLEYYREEDAPQEHRVSKRDLDTVLKLGTDIVGTLDRSHTLEELANRSGLNPKKLQSAFRHLYGTSVGSFVRDARLERARELLETTDMNVSEAVYAVGLSSRSYFTKAFTARYGIRPSELIDTHRP